MSLSIKNNEKPQNYMKHNADIKKLAKKEYNGIIFCIVKSMYAQRKLQIYNMYHPTFKKD